MFVSDVSGISLGSTIEAGPWVIRPFLALGGREASQVVDKTKVKCTSSTVNPISVAPLRPKENLVSQFFDIGPTEKIYASIGMSQNVAEFDIRGFLSSLAVG
jgi:hypothetical protein